MLTTRTRHLGAGALAALVALSLAALPTVPASAAPTPPTQRGFLPAGSLPQWTQAIVDATGSLITYGQDVSGPTEELTLAITTSDGTKKSQNRLAFRPASIAPAPGGGAILLDSRQIAGAWQAQAFLVDGSGAAATTVPVPADTIQLATTASGTMATVSSDGSVLLGRVGDGAFRTIGSVADGVTDLVVHDDGTVYTCGGSVTRITAGAKTTLPSAGAYCLSVADDESSGGVVANWFGGKFVAYHGDLTTTTYGLDLRKPLSISNGNFDVLNDGDLVLAPSDGVVLYRYDIASGVLSAIGAASSDTSVDASDARFSIGYKPVFAVGADDAVYISRDQAGPLAGAVDRLNMDDSEYATFAGYPAIVGARQWYLLKSVFPRWSGVVQDPQFTLVSGSLPPGVTLNKTTGALLGVPSARGVFTAVIGLTASGSAPITTTVTIDVESRRTTY